MKNETINTHVREDCCGCVACSFVCPRNAIKIRCDDEGFAYPQIDEELCISCGRCLQVCAFQNSVRKPNESETPLVYGMKHKDEEVRRASRSGGVFTAITDVVLEQGGVVYGAAAVSPYEVKHIRATSKEDRNLMRGSKYVESNLIGIYSQLESDLLECADKPILFSGSPCQCAAVASVFKQAKYSNLILCDFICHGVPSSKLHKDYLTWIERKYRKPVEKFEFRDKEKFPWESHVERIELGGKRIYSRRYTNLFYANQCLRPSCFSCRYTTILRVSDFSIADFWGCDKINPEFNDHKGISVVIVRGEKASILFSKAKNQMECIEVEPHSLPHYSLHHPTTCPKNRQIFWDDYKHRGFEYISKKYGGYDFLRRIKAKILYHLD